MRRSTDALAPLRQWGRVSGRLSRRGFWPLAGFWSLCWFIAFYGGRVEALVLAILLIWPISAAAGRRLHDGGWSSAWVLLGLLPFAWPILTILLLWTPITKPSVHDRPRDEIVPAAVIGAAAIAVSLIWVFGTPVLIHRANMKPTLLPGDLVYVWRFGGGGMQPASCWPGRCPVTFAGEVPRAQVVVLAARKSPPSAGRVAALAGERIEFAEGKVLIDQEALPRRPVGLYQEFFQPTGPDRLLPRCGDRAVGLGSLCKKTAWQEQIGDRAYFILDGARTGLDILVEAQVPDGRLFLLSDNRDTIEDSRMDPRAGGLGFASSSDIVGRAAFVIASARGTSPWAIWTWRWNRIGKKVS